ncbi:MAG: Phosphate acyltransferase [Thermacetogenium phaeum]|uniref:Phosphate acyltransferase n=1 Tax=Thermacetogenium phaeum TaxID=85874 RepID=A0A117LB74_9THEO|nr:MAG: Phosphate acyltransferase [Thermacetogenium phaeum]
MIIAVDAMGGDFAPAEVIKGAVDAVREEGVEIILVGPERIIEEELSKHHYPSDRISIANATEVIGMNEHPATAVRRKRDSSLMVAAQLVKKGQASALISAGNTGAQMAASLLVLGRLAGIERPGIATILPSPKGPRVLIDSGANVDTRAVHIVQFAYLGKTYAESVLGIANPRVALLNVGGEPNKGSESVREAYRILEGAEKINFVGNIEGRDLLTADVDVIACDGFVGNVVLKTAEGLAMNLVAMMKNRLRKNPFRMLGGILVRPALKEIFSDFDYTEIGGAPLLGVQGISIICHGSSHARAIRSAIRTASRAVKGDLVGRISKALNLEDNTQ